MKRIAIAALAASAFVLAGCGGAFETFSKETAFEITLVDGTTAQCVKVTGGNSGDVAVHCKYTDEVTP